MKNILRLGGIIACAVVMGFMLTSCSDDPEGDKVVIIGGYDEADNKIPKTPTKIVATEISSSSITISWREISGALQYYVYSSLTEAGTYIRLGPGLGPGVAVSSVGPTCSYTAGELTPKTTYFFKVSAVNHLGESPQSEPISATTATPSYTVTFYANGGTGVTPPSQKAYENTAITLPSGSGLSRPGYTFTGWSTVSYGTGGEDYNAGASFQVTNNTTLYAKWSTPYTVTFYANGGSGTLPSPLTETAAGSGITLPSGSGLSYPGSTFSGWYNPSLGTGTTYQAGENYKPASDITLYAKWNSINATTLTADVWTDGRLSTANGEDWYSFTVTSGTTYRIWWNDNDEGNGTKTGDVAVSAQINGTFIFGGTDDDEDTGWTTPKTITNQYGTVYIRVIPLQRKSTYTGTYSIVFSTGTTRPSL
jgi:uncharacterized repeat protein (TIGR02543 family)